MGRFRLLDRCFYQSQVIAIRRLMDTKPLVGPKGAFSLKRLVQDMKENRRVFTRRNLFAAFDLAIDVDAVLAAEREYCRGQVPGSTIWTPRNLDASACASLHREIDGLADLGSANRSDGDVVACRVFEGLERWIARIDKICKHVNKYVAHAATPESRACVDSDTASVTYAELWQAHEIICRTCQFIDGALLRQNGLGFLATFSGDLFEYADQPLATTARIPMLKNGWATFESETQTWGHTGLDWVLSKGSTT